MSTHLRKKKKNKKIPLNLYRTYPQNKELTQRKDTQCKKKWKSGKQYIGKFFSFNFLNVYTRGWKGIRLTANKQQYNSNKKMRKIHIYYGVRYAFLGIILYIIYY